MPTTDDFKNTLKEIIDIAKILKLTGIIVRSGNLHRIVGGYPAKNHRMRMCCNAMRQLMETGDEIVTEPPCGDGANFEVLYRL